MSNQVRDFAGASTSLMAASDQIIGDPDLDRIRRLGMSPRQQHLNWLWSKFRAMQYEGRKVCYDGSTHFDPVELEAFATQTQIPPGFYDAAEQAPMRMRRPVAAYHMVRVIVKRFTGLLFSERRHPRIVCPGDLLTEKYAKGIGDASRIWAAMTAARNYGGACGAVPVGFRFKDGKPLIEVHSPIWSFPLFEDRSTLKLKALEKRYIYNVETRDARGRWVDVPHWYRRVIDKNTDKIWDAVMVGHGDEPDWRKEPHRVIEHNLNECPVVWIKNTETMEDEIDGEPDCHGTYDQIEEIDRLVSEAVQGIKLNTDPTVVLEGVEDSQIPPFAKGSNNAIKLPKGTAHYLEINGTGSEKAFEAADKLRSWVLETCQCVLEEPDVANRTATEVERNYSSMMERADTFREQYGQRGVIPLLELEIRCARKVGKVRQTVDGVVVKPKIILPPVVTQKPGEDPKVEMLELGEEETQGQLGLTWPRYFDPSIQDIGGAVDAAMKAEGAGLVDDEHAVRFISEYFHVEDVPALIAKLQQQKADKEQQMQDQMMNGLGGGGGAGGFGRQPFGGGAPGGGDGGGAGGGSSDDGDHGIEDDEDDEMDVPR